MEAAWGDGEIQSRTEDKIHHVWSSGEQGAEEGRRGKPETLVPI